MEDAICFGLNNLAVLANSVVLFRVNFILFQAQGKVFKVTSLWNT